MKVPYRYVYSCFKNGYSEFTYPLNVVEFGLLIIADLKLYSIGDPLLILASIGFSIVLTMTILGRWNLKPGTHSIIKKDLEMMMKANQIEMAKDRMICQIAEKLDLDSSELRRWIA